MGKYKRLVVGTAWKANDKARTPSIKFNLAYHGGTLTLKDGQYLNIESKQFQLASLDEAVKAGRLTEENANKARERANKIPDSALGEVILLVPKD